MLDVAVAYNRYKFIGNEFLTWLWFIIDANPDYLKTVDQTIVALNIGNRIVLENNSNDSSEIITIKGDDAGLEEGILSLRKGAVVIEMNLIYKTENQDWKFSLKGESLSFSGLKLLRRGPWKQKTILRACCWRKLICLKKRLN
ncbi:hypothetical protein [Desulfosarcina cetonica]|uniref:hypothetical protein n=1 Tax=Desulfosarcina cetonica TaxID=90730 RepID=UPI001FEEBE09|nr:hypothetical protein [Desulfosarcina cetonica]